jgi:hypothetical protein
MRLPRLSKPTEITRRVWLALPSIARFALIGLGRRPGDVTLGELRAAGMIR